MAAPWWFHPSCMLPFSSATSLQAMWIASSVLLLLATASAACSRGRQNPRRRRGCRGITCEPQARLEARTCDDRGCGTDNNRFHGATNPCNIHKPSLCGNHARWQGYAAKAVTMYHGTSRAGADKIMRHGFQQASSGLLGTGVYLSLDPNRAARYGDTVMVVEVKLGKVKDIDSESHPLRTSWNAHGYNTARIQQGCSMLSSGLKETCVFNPKRVRVIREL